MGRGWAGGGGEVSKHQHLSRLGADWSITDSMTSANEAFLVLS